MCCWSHYVTQPTWAIVMIFFLLNWNDRPASHGVGHVRVLQMLQEPHADNPLEADIARQLAEDKEAFAQTAKKWTLDFASP